MDRREPLGTIEIVAQFVPTPYTYVKFLNFFTASGESTKYMELYRSAMDIQRLTMEVDGSPTKFKGRPWNFMGAHGNCMELHGMPWKFIDVHRNP